MHKPSSGRGLAVKGSDEIDNNGNSHFYVVVNDGLEVTTFVDRLFDHAVLAGWGYAVVRKGGRIDILSVFDRLASRDSSRIWFELDAVCSDDVDHAIERKSSVRPGGILDITGLEPLSESERTKHKAIIKQLREAVKPEAEREKKRFVAELTETYVLRASVRTKHGPWRRRRAASRRCSARTSSIFRMGLMRASTRSSISRRLPC